MPQENERQIWNQHRKVTYKSYVIFLFNTKSVFFVDLCYGINYLVC